MSDISLNVEDNSHPLKREDLLYTIGHNIGVLEALAKAASASEKDLHKIYLHEYKRLRDVYTSKYSNPLDKLSLIDAIACHERALHHVCMLYPMRKVPL